MLWSGAVLSRLDDGDARRGAARPLARAGIGINGAAARLVSPGDLVIIIAYGLYTREEALALRPSVVHVDGHNRVVHLLGTDSTEALVPGLTTSPSVARTAPGA